ARVALTGRGPLLCRHPPSSLSAAFATVGNSDVAHGLTDTLRSGRAAAPRVLGMGYWEYLAAHPDQQALFDQPQVLEHARPFLDARGVPTAAGCTQATCSPPHHRRTCTCWPACCTTGTTPTRPASWRRWATAPPATPGCGSSRCCCPPTPPRIGP